MLTPKMDRADLTPPLTRLSKTIMEIHHRYGQNTQIITTNNYYTLLKVVGHYALSVLYKTNTPDMLYPNILYQTILGTFSNCFLPKDLEPPKHPPIHQSPTLQKLSFEFSDFVYFARPLINTSVIKWLKKKGPHN